MKKWLSAVTALALLWTLPQGQGALANDPPASGSSNQVTQIDVVTQEGAGFRHPDQITMERTLSAGAPRLELLHRALLPAGTHSALALKPGSRNLYVANRQDGLIWEMDPNSGKVFRQIKPSWLPTLNIQGLAAGAAGDLYVYYRGSGMIQRLSQTGELWNNWQAPTTTGNSLAYRDKHLYLLDRQGIVYQIDANSKQTVKKVTLKRPDGQEFAGEQAQSLFFDGKYWNILNLTGVPKLHRYSTDWQYVDSLDGPTSDVSGVQFNGQEYVVLHHQQNLIATMRLADDQSGLANEATSDHYQYLGNVLTTQNATRAYPTYDDRNVLLVYSDLKNMTSDDFKPVVSYLDSTGKRTGSMFDSFVFLPSAQNKTFYRVTDPQGWREFMNDALKDMAVLDKEWGERNRELQTLTKAKVYMAVPYPNPQDALGLRKQLIREYVDEAMLEMYGRKFANLEIRGFYWHAENAFFAEELVVDFNRYVHQKGLLTMWIPYFGAEQAGDYAALGFDEVFQQPNYYFDKYAQNANRFSEVAWTGARYRKGVEMELDRNVLHDNTHRQRFLEYLKYGLAQGWLNGSKAWYDGGGAIAGLYQQQDTLYDTIYEVLQGTYQHPGVNIPATKAGPLFGSMSVSVPMEAKIRLNVLHEHPFHLQKVVLHVSDPDAEVMTFTGTLRVDEELAVRDGKLVKQAMGQPADSLRLGFNVPLTSPVEVWILPKGKTPYADLSGHVVQAPAIMTLTSMGIFNGTVENGVTLFKPEEHVTRAEYAALLTRIDDLAHVQQQAPFADAQNAWFTSSVATVVEHEVMQGVDEDHFAPQQQVTQEEVAVALVRLMHVNNVRAYVRGHEQIANLDKVSPWAKELVLEGKKLGLYGDKFGTRTFDPQAYATRADIAEVLHKALRLLEPGYVWKEDPSALFVPPVSEEEEAGQAGETCPPPSEEEETDAEGEGDSSAEEADEDATQEATDEDSDADSGADSEEASDTDSSCGSAEESAADDEDLTEEQAEDEAADLSEEHDPASEPVPVGGARS